MAYFRTYTYSFTDTHEAHPAEWRVDILDDEANAGVVPIELIPSFESLVLERIETSDDKATSIIGRQAVLQYEYAGANGDPLPEHFFDVDERRFRVEIYKNGLLYDIFYIKPDSCEYEYKAPPYTVTLTAVDGLSFTKGVIWNAYTDNGILDYRWMSLYEIIIERGLLQIFDEGIETNVINTLRPDNAVEDKSFLNDLYVHSDMFIDFTKGPDDVYTVLDKILKQFYLRLFVSQNKIWIIRMPDLLQDTITAENYINGILNDITLQTARRNVGVSRTTNDATPVDQYGKIIMFPAIKKVQFTLNYRSINKLLNFQWSDFDGTNFADWDKNAFAFTVSRNGTGSIEDPYSAFLPFSGEQSPDDPLYTISQGSGVSPILVGNIGDIFQISFRYKFSNTSNGYFSVYGLDTITGDTIALGSDGNWSFLSGAFPPVFTIGRSGKKRDGSFSISSQPIPKIVNEHTLSGNPFQFFIALHTPVGLNTLDGSLSAGIDIYPVKLGIYSISSAGRDIININNSRFSKDIDKASYWFIDTGEENISNTIAIDDDGMPAQNWSAIGAPTDKQDVERHMADSTIDQYAKSVYGWEGSLYSNTIEFWNILTFDQLPGRQFVQMTDRYIVNTCTHVTNLQEILPENGADTTYTEIDIEDAND